MEVFGTVTAVVGLLGTIKDAHDKFKDAKHLPEAFREITGQADLARNIFQDVKEAVNGPPESGKVKANRGKLLAVQSTVMQCNEDSKTLANIFEETIQHMDGPWYKKYLDIVSSMAKDRKGKAEEIWARILKGSDLLATTFEMEKLTDIKRDIKAAIEKIERLPSSLREDGTGNNTWNNHGSGTIGVQGHNHAPMTIGQSYNAPVTNHNGVHASITAGRDVHFHTSTRQMNEEEKRRTEKACEDCLKDLFLTDPTTHLSKARDFSRDGETARDRKGRAPGTCQWVESDDSYQGWFTAPAPTLLWVAGEPGIGKTILSTHLLEDVLPRQLAASNSSLAYFLCNNNTADSTRNNAVAILRGLLWLLLDRNRDLYKHFQKDHSSKNTKCFEDKDAKFTLWSIFENIVSSFSSDDAHLCILIDAFDECERESRKWLWGKIRELLCNESVHLKVILTSRLIDGTENLYKNFTSAKFWLYMVTSKVKADLDAFIDHEVGHRTKEGHWKHGRLSADHGWDQDTATAVYDKLVANHGGTFLWVSLVLDSLAGVPSLLVLDCLSNTPDELNGVYQRILSDIEQQPGVKTFAVRILRLVLSATTPMSLNVLALALYFDLKAREHLPNQGHINSHRDMIKTCGLLLRMDGDPETNQVTIIHQSVKDFMTGNQVDDFWYYSSANRRAAGKMYEQICTNYICTKEFNDVSKDALRIHAETTDLIDASKSWPPIELTEPPHPSWTVLAGTIDLLDYLGSSFHTFYMRTVSIKHRALFDKVYALSPTSQTLAQNDIGNLLDDDGPRHIVWRLMTIALRKTYNDVLSVICTLCHHSQNFTLSHGAKQPAWCADQFLFDLLSTTVVCGNPTAAKTLAAWLKTFFHYSWPKADGWIQLWFDVDSNMPDCYNLSPASTAISQRIAAFDALVLGLSGCDTPLHTLATNGKTSAILRIFDDNNRDRPDRRGELLAVQDWTGVSPLSRAIDECEWACAELLIRMDRDGRSFQMRDRYGLWPLHLFLAECELGEPLDSIADNLVNLQQNILDARNEQGQVLLHIAAQRSAAVSEALIKADQEGNTILAQDKNGSLPLHVALSSPLCPDHTILLLIDADPDKKSLYVKDNSGNTPLHLVALRFEAFLEQANCLEQADWFWLTHEVEHRIATLVQFRAERGIEVETALNAKDSDGFTLLDRCYRAMYTRLMSDELSDRPVSDTRFYVVLHNLAGLANALRSCGGSVNSQNPIANQGNQKGMLVIHLVASQAMTLPVIDVVLDADIARTSVNAEDNSRSTPLDLVYEHIRRLQLWTWFGDIPDAVERGIARFATIAQRLRGVGGTARTEDPMQCDCVGTSRHDEHCEKARLYSIGLTNQNDVHLTVDLARYFPVWPAWQPMKSPSQWSETAS